MFHIDGVAWHVSQQAGRWALKSSQKRLGEASGQMADADNKNLCKDHLLVSELTSKQISLTTEIENWRQNGTL